MSGFPGDAVGRPAGDARIESALAAIVDGDDQNPQGGTVALD